MPAPRSVSKAHTGRTSGGDCRAATDLVSPASWAQAAGSGDSPWAGCRHVHTQSGGVGTRRPGGPWGAGCHSLSLAHPLSCCVGPTAQPGALGTVGHSEAWRQKGLAGVGRAGFLCVLVHRCLGWPSCLQGDQQPHKVGVSLGPVWALLPLHCALGESLTPPSLGVPS